LNKLAHTALGDKLFIENITASRYRKMDVTDTFLEGVIALITLFAHSLEFLDALLSEGFDFRKL
jgi:hypothetical protein